MDRKKVNSKQRLAEVRESKVPAFYWDVLNIKRTETL
jgi:hypothetical protein